MKIRPFLGSDRPAAAALAAGTWPHDDFIRAGHDQHGESGDADPFRRCLVAVDDETGRVVGVFSAVRPSTHPLRLELVGTIDADYRRQGIGTALVSALRQDCPGETFRVRVRANDLPTRLFLATRGFTPLQRNRVLAVDPTHPDVLAWSATVAVPVGYELVTSGLAADDVLAMCHAIYLQGHQWNPPAELSMNRQRDAYFAGVDQLPEPLIAARADANLVGVVYGECEQGNTSELFIMPSGVLGLDRPGAVEATATMVAHCLTWAREHGRTVIFEVDDDEEHIAAVLSALPTRPVSELLHVELAPAAPGTVE